MDLADRVIRANENEERRAAEEYLAAQRREEEEHQYMLQREERQREEFEYRKRLEEKRKEELEARNYPYYQDDLGFVVRKDIKDNPQEFAEYIKFRCRILNKRLYQDDGILYLGNRRIEPIAADIAQLSLMPNKVSLQIAVVVYEKLLNEVPPLVRDKIYLGSGFYWDYEKADLVEMPSDNSYIIRKEDKGSGRETTSTRDRFDHYARRFRDSCHNRKLYGNDGGGINGSANK